MTKEDIGNRRRLHNRIVKSFPGLMGQDIANFARSIGVNGEVLDNMSTEDFNELMKLVVPKIVEKSNNISQKNKNTPWEKKWFDAGQSFNSSWPFNWDRNKFLKELGREKLSDAELLALSSDVPKNSVKEQIIKDPHIGTLNNDDYAKLRNAGLYDDEIEYLADKFRQEYQDQISKKAEMEFNMENQKADHENVNEFENPSNNADWLASKTLKLVAPEKWAMMRDDVANRNDRGATEGVTDPDEDYQAAKYLFNLWKDGGWKDDVRNVAFLGSGYATKIPGASKLNKIGLGPLADTYAPPLALAGGDMANDALSNYYEVNPAKSIAAATAAGTVPALTTYVPRLAMASGNARLINASRKIAKRLRRGVDMPAEVEKQNLMTEMDDAIGVIKEAKKKGNAFRLADKQNELTKIAEKINNSPRAAIDGTEGTWDVGKIEKMIGSKNFNIENLYKYITPLSKEEYVKYADIMKSKPPKIATPTENWELLDEKQKATILSRAPKEVTNNYKKSLAKFEDYQQKMQLANKVLDYSDKMFPQNSYTYKEAPSVGMQKQLDNVFNTIGMTANAVGSTMEPFLLTRRNSAMPWQGDDNNVSAEKMGDIKSWDENDSLYQSDPLYYEWKKSRNK